MNRNFILTYVTLATLCICSSGQAADMTVKARPLPSPPPPYNWSGFYIGGNFGGVWSSVDIHDSDGNSFSTSGTSGFMAGGQIGFNYQAVGSPFVFGVEFDGDWTNLKRTSGFVDVGGVSLQAEVSTPAITSLAGRFGFAADRFFLYGKAGVGWVGNKLTIRDDTGDSISRTNSRSGFLFGGGGEYAIDRNWTIKLEYDHINLGDRSITDTNCVLTSDCTYTVTAHRNIDM